MDGAIEDEKKPFDAETAQDDDAQPDPDEHLMLNQGSGAVWIVKVPKFLMERWSAVNAEDVHLATIRLYQLPDGKQRVVLFLPPNRDPSIPPSSQPPPPENPNRPTFDPSAYTTYTALGSEPDCYELDLVIEDVQNQVVVAERPKDASTSAFSSSSQPTPPNSRARTTILTGKIKNEFNMRPALTATYRKQMRERHRKANTPARQIRMIDEAGVPGGRGGVNRLSSGVGVGSGNAFGDLIRTKPKPAKGAFERMARMPRNQLLDALFSLFRESPRWSIKPLRDKTQQPEVYLKEVLQEIAMLHKSGEYNGLWELKDVFKEEGSMKAENVPLTAGTSGDVKMEDDDDDDDDEDDDMEEVS
ncbi:Transcription initiation factor IIF subunit beta [Psilocybe cubensis]|uniref:Transcription initiation factor IIF subunit beta n=2 Tax=Psilocybe cubensis TaxID=181762 RepID=A0A8H8CKI5_PSICU|nr:Transcription initiation factor IIF subunit beta [Psilocybe cubensis]KAH9481083.1 Transcription initiation factor IIF subunit beta [Psilocybe cubensis]